MSVLKLLAGLSSKLKSLYGKKKVEETSEVSLLGRYEGDWLSENPQSWYRGPLILLEETEEGLKEYQAY